MRVSKHSIQCDCHNPAHSVQIVHWAGYKTGNGKEVEESMCLFTQMSHAPGLWKRLKIAFRYIFNLSQGGDYPWADTYMSPKDILKLRLFLNGIARRKLD